MIESILFDLDGTLTDSFEGIANSVIYALKKMGVPCSGKDSLRPFIGPPLYETFGDLFKDEQKTEQAVNFYREYFNDRGWRENRVYDGVTDMLSDLKKQGKKLYIATSKPEYFSRKIADLFGLTEYFDYIAGASMDNSRAAKDKVIDYAVQTVGIDKEHAIMVGDRRQDVLGAKANGLKCIGVLYGYGDKDELTAAGADFIAASPQEVADIINNIE